MLERRLGPLLASGCPAPDQPQGMELPLDGGRVALVMNDLITNVPPQAGFRGFLLRITGTSTGRPRVIPLVRRGLRASLKIKRHEMRAYLLELAQRPEIALITTSHGECVTSDVAAALANVARDLEQSSLLLLRRPLVLRQRLASRDHGP